MLAALKVPRGPWPLLPQPYLWLTILVLESCKQLFEG